ncbi:MAG: hypothetical protein JWO06_1315, partial [Bacteroidota bacterium]|nr:hypothetical protein [Bacteroidota bacterium]
VLKVVENNPLANNPMVHFHAQPLTVNFGVGGQTAFMVGAGADIYLMTALQINADLKVSFFDLYSAGGLTPYYRQIDGSVGVSYGYAFTGHHNEKVYLRYTSKGYQNVREFAKAEEIKRGFHIGGRAGYSVYSGYFNRNRGYENATTHNVYLGIYVTRIRDFFVRNNGSLNGRFAAQKFYMDVLLPFYTSGTVSETVNDNITGQPVNITSKPSGFYPGARFGMGIFPPAVKVKTNGNLQKVAFYLNFETGLRPGAPFKESYPIYFSFGIGLSYMTFKPHFNGDNVTPEHKKEDTNRHKSSPFN